MVWEDLKDRPYGTPEYLEYQAPEVRRSEVLRYSGISRTAALTEAGDAGNEVARETKAVADIEALCDETIASAADAFTYRVVYRQIRLDADVPLITFFKNSENLMKNLTGCEEVIVFAATVGAGIDRLIRRYERTEPSRALLLQAYGAERVEALCDAFNAEVKSAAEAAGIKTHPRYSPGYGDLSIEAQPVLLNMLEAEKRLGITLGTSCLMSPSKSVTAIIGLEKL